MKVRVYRFDPELVAQGRFDEFEVPVPTGEDSWSVMDVLDYISLELDPSLAYYRHSACNHGICGRCVLQVNGKTRLACLHIVDPGQPLVLEPAAKRQRVRDLVTKDKT